MGWKLSSCPRSTLYPTTPPASPGRLTCPDISGLFCPLVSSYVWLTGSTKCGSKDKVCEVRILICILGRLTARSPQLLHDPLLKGHASVGQASPGQLFSLDLRETPSLATSGLRWEKSSVQFSSVAQSCPTLFDPMNRSMPGFPVHHQLLEFTQTHVH